MKVLLDTHVLLWAAASPERLGDAIEVLRRADERLVSAASSWELAIKQGLGKVALGMDTGPWVVRAVHQLGARALEITTAHAAAVEHLPEVHRDPFDRLLVAQARHEGAVLLTADRVLLGYGDVVQLAGSAPPVAGGQR